VPTPAEREWAVRRRGEVREDMLADMREGLRGAINPDTGAVITEDELRISTAKGSWWFREYDSVDVVLLTHQKRAEFLAQQIRADRAHSSFLRTYHAELWDTEYLPAFGGSGVVLARGNPGTVWVGSTVLRDPFAVYGRDPAQRRYQVIASGTADEDGEAELTLIALDGGDETNIVVGTEITWSNAPAGSQPVAEVITADFSGGLDAETDEDFGQRLISEQRHKPGAGNWAQIRSFAREASVSVEDAFVYCCAFHSGSTLVAIVQKRGAVRGPLARLPSVSVLEAVKSALVPPGSSTLPGNQHLVVLPPVAQASDVALQLAQPVNSASGWTDLEPFPPINGTAAIAITLLTNQTDFRITTGGAGQLPLAASSSTEVHLMAWNATLSAFERLEVSTITDLGGGVYRVQLTQAPSFTLALGTWISPDAGRRATIAEGITAYFDTLGTGEVVASADERYARAFRNPVPSEEKPARAGQAITGYLSEALGATVADAQLASISVSTPALPADPIAGPTLLVCGKAAVYPV